MTPSMIQKRGSLLVVSLWILAILSVLATGIAFRMSLEMRLSKHASDLVRVQSIAKAGIFQTIELLKKNKALDYDSLDECGLHVEGEKKVEESLKNISFGDGQYSIVYEQDDRAYYSLFDEDRLIQINTADANSLSATFQVLAEVDVFDSQEIAGAIMDWRDEDISSTRQEGAEGAYYDGLPVPYEWGGEEKKRSVRNKPLKTTEELLLIKGITPEIFQKIKPYVTIFGDSTSFKVNVNTAPKKVLTILGYSVGMSKAQAQDAADRIVALREGKPILPVELEQDQFFINLGIGSQGLNLRNFFKCSSSYYRINSRAKMDGSNIESEVTTVVQKDSGEKVKFLYFQSK